MDEKIQLLEYQVKIKRTGDLLKKHIPLPETKCELGLLRGLLKEKYGEESEIFFTYRTLENGKIKTTTNDNS